MYIFVYIYFVQAAVNSVKSAFITLNSKSIKPNLTVFPLVVVYHIYYLKELILCDFMCFAIEKMVLRLTF